MSVEDVDKFASKLEFASAHVRAASFDEAVDLIRGAMEVLRVFQQSQRRWQTTMFGLPGELHEAKVSYLALGDIAGVGWTFRGHHAGWTFSQDQVAEFNNMPGFVFAVESLGRADTSEGARRAQLAVSLASQAILEHRPPNQLLYTVIAAEALLLDRSPHSQSYRLARRCVYFLCGQPEGQMCGRQRDTCPVLAASPETAGGRKELGRFRERGQEDARWRCSEWHHVLDWYDDRSDVVHSGRLASPDDEAGKALFWLVTRLIPEVLAWLAEHPDNPLSDLEAAIEALPEPPDWEAIIG
jgi:hypothetical protein